MFRALNSYLTRHPLVCDALLWAIPAALFGGFLRALLLDYMPYAYWGSDSKSFFDFAHKFLAHGGITMDAKRRYVYPIWMLFVGALPGSPLRWTAWLQHLLGLVTLVPLAYTVRKLFTHWRWVIVPVTVLYAGLPVILWYEHELIGDCLFVDFVVWACAGWAAWAGARNLQRSQELWWWFFTPFALMMLIKPSGRFYVPGVVLGIVLIRGWRVLNWRHGVAFLAVLLLTLGMGKETQSSWLLYSTAFPLTRLDTPLHADYKAEIREMVEKSRASIDTYYADDQSGFLRRLENATDRPLWMGLGNDEMKKVRIFKELSLEGIKHRPDLFLYISIQRILASANSFEFKQERYAGKTYAKRFAHLYDEMVTDDPDYFRFLFSLPRDAPIPDYEAVTRWVSPAPTSWSATILQNYVARFSDIVNFFHIPDGGAELGHTSKVKGEIASFRPTFLGLWMMAGAMLSLVSNRYRVTLGVWTLAAGSYLFGTFLLGVPSPRYFSPAWPVMVLLLAIPAECLLRLAQLAVLKLRRRE